MQAKAKEDKERVAALKAEGGEAGQAGGSVGKENKAKKERKPTIKSAYMVRCPLLMNSARCADRACSYKRSMSFSGADAACSMCSRPVSSMHAQIVPCQPSASADVC